MSFLIANPRNPSAVTSVLGTRSRAHVSFSSSEADVLHWTASFQVCSHAWFHVFQNSPLRMGHEKSLSGKDGQVAEEEAVQGRTRMRNSLAVNRVREQTGE